MDLKAADTVQAAVGLLHLEAKKKGDMWLKEVWIEDHRLCYCFMQYVSDHTVSKERAKLLAEKEQRKIAYEGPLQKRRTRNWKSVTGKVNLCKTSIPEFRDRAKEFRRKEIYDYGDAKWHYLQI